MELVRLHQGLKGRTVIPKNTPVHFEEDVNVAWIEGERTSIRQAFVVRHSATTNALWVEKAEVEADA